MSLSTNQSILRGSFTSDGASQIIPVPWFPSRFQVRNITQFGSAAVTTPVMIAERTSLMPENSALTQTKTNGAATLDLPTMNLTDGISFINNVSEVPGPELTGTAINQDGPALVSIVAHGLKVGDKVRVYNTTAMLQIAGLVFSVVSVPSPDTFTILMNTTGFAAPASFVNARKVSFTRFFPPLFTITNITQAAQALIQLSISGVEQFDIGQEVRLIVPSEFGMVEANDQRVRVVAVNNAAGQITVDLDSAAFSTFAFPTSATAAAGITFPQVVPFGKFGGIGLNPLSNQSEFQVELGTNALGGNNDVMEWFAERALLFS